MKTLLDVGDFESMLKVKIGLLMLIIPLSLQCVLNQNVEFYSTYMNIYHQQAENLYSL